MTRLILEIAANSLSSALAAQEGGADRVELCADLEHGGTTASYGTIAITRDRLRIPLYVLIRPRVGDFCYDANEIEVMVRDVETCAKIGCDGVVIGALDANGDVDAATCRELVSSAAKLGLTFHRAFDAARDRFSALDTIVELGCDRVLTSGGEATASAGAECIAESVNQAGSRLRIVAGAGLDPGNIRDVALRSGALEFHGSAKALRRSSGRPRDPGLPGLEQEWWETDASLVRAIREELSRVAAVPTSPTPS